jgi:hypothetical protein
VHPNPVLLNKESLRLAESECGEDRNLVNTVENHRQAVSGHASDAESTPKRSRCKPQSYDASAIISSRELGSKRYLKCSTRALFDCSWAKGGSPHQ